MKHLNGVIFFLKGIVEIGVSFYMQTDKEFFPSLNMNANQRDGYQPWNISQSLGFRG